MLTEQHIKTLIKWVPLFRGIPDGAAILAGLRELREAAGAPLAFYPLPTGCWRIGDRPRGRVPKGLRLAHAAIHATQTGNPPPTAGACSHGVRKAIKTDAVRWAKRNCSALLPVLAAISVVEGEILFDARPGVPKIECLPPEKSECLPSA